MNIKCESDDGGCVEFNREVTVSSHVAGVADFPRVTTHMYLKKKKNKRCKKTAQVFFNSETGLLVVDVIDANGEGGREVFRQNIL